MLSSLSSLWYPTGARCSGGSRPLVPCETGYNNKEGYVHWVCGPRCIWPFFAPLLVRHHCCSFLVGRLEELQEQIV